MTDRLPIARALSVLEALGRRTPMRLSDLAEATGLAPPTVARLLNALIAAGYAERLSRAAGYRATSRVLGLSAGFDEGEQLVEAAIPLIRAFTLKHKWPVFLGLREGPQMAIRFGSVTESPMAVDPNVFHAPSPMLLSAVGRAYLAFCPAGERDEILARLRASRRSVDRAAKDEAALARMLADVRARGYASTDEGLRRMTAGMPPAFRDARKRAMGLAVPVMDGARVVASLSLRYFSAVMSAEEAAARHLAPLRALATGIAAATPPRRAPVPPRVS